MWLVVCGGFWAEEVNFNASFMISFSFHLQIQDGQRLENAIFKCLAHSAVFLAATKQLYKWYFPSVRLSVTPFWLCSHHGIIMKFSGVITNDKSKVMQKVKVT